MCVVAGEDGRECRDMCDESYEPEDYTKGTTEGAASTVEDMRYSFIPGFSDCDNWFLTVFLYFLAICLIGCLAAGILMAAGIIPMPVRSVGGGRKPNRGLSQQRFDPVLDVPPAGGPDEMRAPMVDEPHYPTPETRVAVGQNRMELERFQAQQAQQGVMQSMQAPDFTTPYQGPPGEYGMQAPYTPTPSRPLPPPVMQQQQQQVQMQAQQGQPITYMQPQAQMAQAPVQQQGYLPTALTQLVGPQYQRVVPPPPQGMNPMSTQPPASFQTGSMQVPSQQGSYYYR